MIYLVMMISTQMKQLEWDVVRSRVVIIQNGIHNIHDLWQELILFFY